jgi:DNA-binding NarL/FixJ family response regulator
MPRHIYLVEDHPVMRQAYADLLSQQDDLVLCGMAATAEQALSEITVRACDLLITDLTLPGMDGAELTARVRASRPDLPIVVISLHNEPAFVLRARDAGATAYLSKDGLARTLPTVLRAILRSGSAAWVDEPTALRAHHL